MTLVGSGRWPVGTTAGDPQCKTVGSVLSATRTLHKDMHTVEPTMARANLLWVPARP
eukprot:COSAG06_NODE_1227_length_10181_cov_4.722277_10_plen_57_part_00